MSANNTVTFIESTTSAGTRFAVVIDGFVGVIAPSTKPGFTRSVEPGSPAWLLGTGEKQTKKATRRVASGSWLASSLKLTKSGRLPKAATTALWAGTALPKTDAESLAATRAEIREAQIEASKSAKSAKSATRKASKAKTAKAASKAKAAKAAPPSDRLEAAMESLAAGQAAIMRLIALGNGETAAAAK